MTLFFSLKTGFESLWTTSPRPEAARHSRPAFAPVTCERDARPRSAICHLRLIFCGIKPDSTKNQNLALSVSQKVA